MKPNDSLKIIQVDMNVLSLYCFDNLF
jgi:hypothetical protein